MEMTPAMEELLSPEEESPVAGSEPSLLAAAGAPASSLKKPLIHEIT
jgi:hypothetical protein